MGLPTDSEPSCPGFLDLSPPYSFPLFSIMSTIYIILLSFFPFSSRARGEHSFYKYIVFNYFLVICADTSLLTYRDLIYSGTLDLKQKQSHWRVQINSITSFHTKSLEASGEGGEPSVTLHHRTEVNLHKHK